MRVNSSKSAFLLEYTRIGNEYFMKTNNYTLDGLIPFYIYTDSYLDPIKTL